jgi:hypothetical protein
VAAYALEFMVPEEEEEEEEKREREKTSIDNQEVTEGL